MLLNVRLGPEEERFVQSLRRSKVNVSALVRKAIREAARATRSIPPEVVLMSILSEHPVRRASKSTRPPLDDRRAIKGYLRKRLRP